MILFWSIFSPFRHGFRAVLISFLLCATWHAPVLGESYELTDSRKTSDLQSVKTTLQVRGKIQLENAKEDPNVELAASAQLAYQEYLVTNPGTLSDETPHSAARYYSVAKAKLRVGGHDELVKMNEAGQWIVARSGTTNTLASAQVPLSRPELELLTVPGNSLVAYRLLPNKSVEEGATWTHSDEAIAALVNLDEVTVNETRSRLVEVKQGLARMQLTGTISGNVNGAASRLKISGDYRYDLNWKHITWLKLVVEELRETSPTNPGFNVRAEMRMLAEPVKDTVRLNEQVVKKMLESVPSRGSLLRFESLNGGYRLIHDANWHVHNEGKTNAHLRLVSDGQTIAQCNIQRLKQRSPEQPLLLDEFKQGVVKALEDRYTRLLSAREWKRKDNYNILKVVAEGEVDKIPIQWTYYHLSSAGGHCATYVFTLEKESAESFTGYDQMMVDSIKLAEIPDEKQNPARQATRKSAPRSQTLNQAPRL